MNKTQRWKKRRERRRRMEMAKKGIARPFLAQRPVKPMPPLIRTGERTETCELPDGTVVTARCQLWNNKSKTR